MEASSLFVGIATLIVLAVTSLRYGVDSRDGFVEKRHEYVPNGLVGHVPTAPQRPPESIGTRSSRLVVQPADCPVIPCPA